MNYITDNYIDEYIAKTMFDKNKEEENNHKSSGKLSAGMLGMPLQWQILKIKGIPQKEFDSYTLRKFQRGKDVEKWFVGVLPNVIETQKFLEYRGCIGYCDAVVDTSTHNFKQGIIPHECKSVSNEKFKKIKSSKGADRSHKLQACLYALALGKDYFAIDYIASDDYRIMTMVYPVADYKDEVDGIIDRFNQQMATGFVPVFIPEEIWQSSEKYSNYPEFAKLNQEEINNLIKEYESKT